MPIIPVSVFGAHRIITRGRKIRLRDILGTPVRCIGEPLLIAPDDDIAQASEILRTRLQSRGGRGHRLLCGPGAGRRWWLPASRGGSAMTAEQDAAKYADEKSATTRPAEPWIEISRT